MKHFPTILLTTLCLTACDSPESLDQTRALSFQEEKTPQPELCDYRDCPSCTNDPVLSDLKNVPMCWLPPAVALEGWACCEWDLSLCAYVGIEVDDTCMGIYYWCDYGEINPLTFEFECWDEWGQG